MLSGVKSSEGRFPAVEAPRTRYRQHKPGWEFSITDLGTS